MSSINKTPPDQSERDSAIDPKVSCLVQAPAGSGKTTLLVKRYIALLGVVNEPEEILAITFTRKAAKEMRVRIVEQLNSENPDELSNKALQRSLDRDWDLLANPQRMKIQTIDSFVSSLVRQLPYESQHSLDFTVTENSEVIYSEAINKTLNRVASTSPQSEFADEIADTLGLLDNETNIASSMLGDLLTRRERWLEPIEEIIRSGAQLTDSEELVQSLQDARHAYVERLKEDVRNHLGTQFVPLANLVALSLKVLDPSSTADATMSTSQEWNQLANILITTTPTVRKNVNKNQGFPPKGHEFEHLKADWQDVMEEIKETLDCETIVKVKNLPDGELTESQQKAITNIAITVVAAWQDLVKQFQANGMVDFAEVEIAARRALEKDDAPTQLALALDYRIKHILVDEFQDTSISQNDLLNLLTEGWQPDDGNSLFLVGDPQQSIYGFRNAELSNFINATDGGIRNVALKKLQLTSNFRSTGQLVGFCNETFAEVLGQEDNAEVGKVAFAESLSMIDADPDSEIKITATIGEDQDLEAAKVAEKIVELHEKHPEDTIAVLFRTRSNLRPYFESFRSMDIHWNAVEMEALSDVAVVRDLYSLTCLLNDLEDRQSWLAVFGSPLVGIELLDLEKLSEHGEENRVVDMLLESDTLGLSSVATTILNRVKSLILGAIQDHNRSLRARTERLFYQLGGANAYAKLSATHTMETTKTNAEHYFDLLEGFESETIDLGELWQRVEGSHATETTGSAYVEVMTIHKAKGLEFDHVILPYLNQGTRPEAKQLINMRTTPEGVVFTYHSQREPDPLHETLHMETKARVSNEALRLLYVAATRAKRTLWLYGTATNVDKSTKGSFLTTVLACAKTEFIEWEGIEPEDESDDSSDESEIVPIRRWRRIDPNFKFAAPETLPPITANAIVDDELKKSDIEALSSLRSEAIEIGLIVHAELSRRVVASDLEPVSEARVTIWRNTLRARGFETRQILQMLERIQYQVDLAIESEVGRWILDSSHEGSDSEASYAMANGNASSVRVVDRTFIDEDGYRWVIDYKTSIIPDNRDIPLSVKALAYQEQLIQYAEIFEGLDDNVPVKAAIYFSDVPELVSVDISQDARNLLDSQRDQKN